MPIVRAFILGGAAVLLQALIFAYVASPDHLAMAFMVAAGLYGAVTGFLAVYALTPRGLWQFTLDVTWSLPNTITGLVWLAWCLARAPMLDPPGRWQRPNAETRRYGMMHVSRVVLGPATATTLGTVVGGRFLLHETVHVQQARILGMFYWPTYLIGFGLAFVVEVLSSLVHALAGRPEPAGSSIDALRDAAYRRTSMEDWAYRATIEGRGIDLWQWMAWFAIGLACAAMCAVIIAPLPLLGALPRRAGLDAIPWWLGGLAYLLYAIGRSRFAKARERSVDRRNDLI